MATSHSAYRAGQRKALTRRTMTPGTTCGRNDGGKGRIAQDASLSAPSRIKKVRKIWDNICTYIGVIG